MIFLYQHAFKAGLGLVAHYLLTDSEFEILIRFLIGNLLNRRRNVI